MEDDRDLLLVAVFTTLTILLWVFFELVKTTQTTTVARPVQQAVTPLTSKIDTDILDVLEKRNSFE
jgi:hypothetical protein